MRCRSIPELAVDPVDWRSQAACRNGKVDMFPLHEAGERAAKAVCRTCTVVSECLDFAMVNREPDGIWGGHTTRERERIRRKLPPSARCHRCGCTIARPARGKRYCNDCAPIARRESVQRYNAQHRITEGVRA